MTLSGATLTPGNEPFQINGATDDQSLLVSGGGSATSPAFCVDSTMPSFRFFVRQTAPGSDLKVQGVVQTPRGLLSMTLADFLYGSLPFWTPVQVTVATNKIPKGFSIEAAMRSSSRARGAGRSTTSTSTRIAPAERSSPDPRST